MTPPSSNLSDATTFNAPARALHPAILIIEDDSVIRNILRTAMKTQGYRILEASSNQNPFGYLSNDLALIIVDLDFGERQGDDLLRELRQRYAFTPIVTLSNCADELSKVQALDIGARYYLTKPFGTNELCARVRSALRLRDRPPSVKDTDQVLRLGDLSVDLPRRYVKVGEKHVYLTPKEYELLLVFLHHAGKVLTYNFLLGALWDRSTNAQYLRIYVRQLRRKIEANPAYPLRVVTETGVGYRMACAA